MFVKLEFSEKWKYIPLVWRYWWVNAVVEYGVTVNSPPPEVVDVTSDWKELLSALSGLQWRTMVPTMDKYLAVPGIRCPWGCACYLHKTNFLSYEDLLLVRSNYAFRSRSPCNYHHDIHNWVHSCRPDFPSSTTILENKHFICRPSIVLKDDGPYILCCLNHNKKCIKRIVHVPINPTGSLYTEASNQYSPVVLRSRTLRKAKLHEYSDTYKTVKLQGGFDGIDSAYCCTIGDRQSVNHLSRQRDYLSLQGRSDVKHNFLMLAACQTSASYLPSENITEMVEEAQVCYPDIENTYSQYLCNSTYVTVEDAVLMQESAYDDRPITIVIENNNESVLFHPPWVSKMIRVHTFDVYGEHFTSVKPPVSQNDPEGYHLWTIMCCFLCVDYIWNASSHSMKTDNDVIGYLMQLSWQQRCRDTRRGKKNKRNNMYSLKCIENNNNYNTTDKIHILIYRLSAENDAEPLEWPSIPGDSSIASFQYSWDPDHVESFVDYVIISFSKEQRACYQQNMNEVHSVNFHPDLPTVFPNNWEPLLIVTKHDNLQTRNRNWDGTVYARHGGYKHIGWWMQENIGTPFRKMKTNRAFSIQNVRLLIYRRKNNTQHTRLRDRYLKFLGGQSVAFCAYHKFPFIASYNTSTSTKCICDIPIDNSIPTNCIFTSDNMCQNKCSFICPNYGCLIGICQKHFARLCHSAENQHYLISRTGCVRRTYETMLQTPEETDEDMISDNNSNNESNDNSSHNETYVRTDGSIVSSTGSSTENDMTYIFGIEETHDNICDLYSDDYEYDDNIQEGVHNEEELGLSGLQQSMTLAQSTEVLGTRTLATDLENHCLQDNTEADVFGTRSLATDLGDHCLQHNNEAISISLHVLLNRQGHCLIRRNAKLRPKQQQKSFMQRFVARSKGKTIPLVYGEASLFPDIFYFSTTNGDILGALPSAFWTDKHTLSRNGIASMRSHSFIRVNDPSLLTSTDNRYHFLAMDILINLGLRGNDSHLLLHRGFAESQDKNEGVALRSQDGTEELYDDNVENHSNVHKLSRLCEQDTPHFFYTQTCNQKTAIGLRIIRNWVISSEAMETVISKYNLCTEEAEKILRVSAAPYVQSTWNIFIDIWMNYITNSPEEPLGPIDWVWTRKEFQDKTGNVSHLHVLIKTLIDDSTIEGKNIILQKIRGALADLFHADELDELIRVGIIDSKACLINIYETAIQYLTHQCGPRCQIVKKNENNEDVLICKRPYNWVMTSNPGVHCMEELFVSHTSVALDIMRTLGLAEDHPTKGIQIIHPKLQKKDISQDVLKTMVNFHQLMGDFLPGIHQPQTYNM